MVNNYQNFFLKIFSSAERKFFGEGDPEQSTLLLAYTAVDPNYGMPKCSYYNPKNLNHGGPRLSNEPLHTDRKQMHLSRHRLRRTVVSDDELETELATQESLVRRLPEDGGPGAQDLGRRLYESAGVIRGRVDFFDILELAYEMGRSMAGKLQNTKIQYLNLNLNACISEPNV